MGLSQALFTAISGLTNHQRAMDNLGNNLANVNTVAFKKGVFQFRTLLEQTMRGGIAATDTRGAINPVMMGLGTQTGSISKNFNQGSLEVTGNMRDMAIEGNGYFVLRQENNTVYTRDGTFYLGSDGSLLGSNGLQVQGVMAEDGAIPSGGQVEDMSIPIGQTGAASETSKVSFTGNLNSDVEVAAGTRIVGNDPDDALTPNPFSSAAVEDYIGDVNYDTSWTAIGTGAPPPQDRYINGGNVITSVGLANFNGGAGLVAADMNTPLEDVLYAGAEDTWIRPFANIQEGDKVSVSFRKGGRRITSEFEYRRGTTPPAAPTVNSYTLGDFMTFLSGGVDDYASVPDVATARNEVIPAPPNLRLEGGVMGTIKLAAKISPEHSDPNATDAYDAPIETAGAFSRQIGTIDYGVPTGVANDFRVSILSNLGAENDITDLEIQFDNVNYTDIFEPDLTYSGGQGGSSTTNLVIYDSLGNPKNSNMQMSLVDRDSNFSTYRWVADSQDDTDAVWSLDPNGVNIDTSANVGTGLIRFDSDGNFVDGVELSESGGLEFTLQDQGVNFPLLVSLREGLSSNQTQDLDFSFLTQVASESDFNLKEQDGNPPGTLDSFTVTTDGEVQGVYSNGVIETVGRLVVGLVPNEQGLIAAGNNLFFEGPSSGAAQIGFANVGGRGAIRAGQLEGSNVDLSEEFTKLITVERGFQANARVVSTSDEMLVELVNLKR